MDSCMWRESDCLSLVFCSSSCVCQLSKEWMKGNSPLWPLHMLQEPRLHHPVWDLTQRSRSCFSCVSWVTRRDVCRARERHIDTETRTITSVDTCRTDIHEDSICQPGTLKFAFVIFPRGGGIWQKHQLKPQLGPGLVLPPTCKEGAWPLHQLSPRGDLAWHCHHTCKGEGHTVASSQALGRTWFWLCHHPAGGVWQFHQIRTQVGPGQVTLPCGGEGSSMGIYQCQTLDRCWPAAAAL